MSERATKIAAVLIRSGRIVDGYQSLINAGRRTTAFIEQLTGNSSNMIREAAPASRVLAELADLVGGRPGATPSTEQIRPMMEMGCLAGGMTELGYGSIRRSASPPVTIVRMKQDAQHREISCLGNGF
jgi:hypothetical protein